jgi:hypothetical protein
LICSVAFIVLCLGGGDLCKIFSQQLGHNLPAKRVELRLKNSVLELNWANIVGNRDWIDCKAFCLLLNVKFFNRSELEDVFKERQELSELD